MFFQVARRNEDKIENQIIRNAFVQLDKNDTGDIDEMVRQNKFQYVEDDDAIYVIGEDALRFAKMFSGKVELRRPLQDGVLNKGEDKKMLVLNELIRSTIGEAPKEGGIVTTCVSSDPIDGSATNVFHERRLRGMFEALGWDVNVIPEGLAVILSENPKATDEDGNEMKATGVGVSFGAGRVNIVQAMKGIVGVGMSASRSGDWIDREVSSQLDIPVAKVTSFKERKLDFDNIDPDDDIQFALDAYYTEMLKYVFGRFAKKFAEEKQGGLDFPLDVVVAGGTSMPKGFVKKLESVIRKLDLPFEVDEVRHATDPRNAVVNGLLVRSELAARSAAREKDSGSKQDSVDDLLNS
jgi:hypothetical protein